MTEPIGVVTLSKGAERRRCIVAETPYKIDVAPGAFATAVLEESRKRPVVVDFWAPWCGPCRVIGPVLERLAAEGQGAWLLAKVNVDQDPEVAARFGIQGIPAVKAFKDGAVTDEFVGALPQAEIRRWIGRLVPSPADEAHSRAKALLEGGKAQEARGELERALELDARHGPSLVALAGLDLERGEPAQALERLERLSPEDADRFAQEVARIKLRARQPAGAGVEQLAAQVERAPDDPEPRMALGWALSAGGRHREALDQFLAVVRKHHRAEPGDQARKAMLEVFDAVGARSDLADEYRAKLARELYR